MVKITNEKIEFSTTNIQTEVFPHIGSILLWGGGDDIDKLTSDGYLLCDGIEYDINNYPKLFATIGNNYGTSASGKFKVPDLRRKFPIGTSPNINIGATGGSKQLVAAHYPHGHTLSFPELKYFNRRGGETGGGRRGATIGYSTASKSLTVSPNETAPQKNYYPRYCIVNYIIRAK